MKIFKELEPTAQQAYRNFPKKLAKYFDEYDAMLDLYMAYHLRFEEAEFIFKTYQAKGKVEEAAVNMALETITDYENRGC